MIRAVIRAALRALLACLLVASPAVAWAQRVDAPEQAPLEGAPASERAGDAGPTSGTASITTPTSVTLPAPAVSLAPYGAGVAALLADGRLVHVAGGRIRTLAQGRDGEVLVACGERLLTVDGAGALGIAGGPVGPRVSLHATPGCLPNGGVLAIAADGTHLLRLGADLAVVARTPLAVLPDAEPVELEGGVWAVPILPTLRYRHGVLGDEVESAGVAIVDPDGLEVLARWDAPNDRVIEQRRVTPFPAAGRWGLIATVSGPGDGGALEALVAEAAANGVAADAAPDTLTRRAAAPGLGRERLWRHVLGASSARIYAVATPHLGGPLERWTLHDGEEVLTREAFALDATSHRIGRRELDLAQLLPHAPGDPDGRDLLLLPSRRLDRLQLVVCDGAGCRPSVDVPLPAPLAAAPWATRASDGGVEAWIADRDGGLRRVRIPGDRIPREPE